MKVFLRRSIYKLADSHWIQVLLSKEYQITRRIFGEAFAQKWLYRLACLLTLDIKQIAGLVNLHRSRLYWHGLHKAYNPPRIMSKSPTCISDRPMRVGIYGYLALTLLTQEPLFRCIPKEIELFVFDIRCPGKYYEYTAMYLEDRAFHYEVFDGDPEKMRFVVDAINSANLDLVINVNYNLAAFQMVDQIDTPCIVHLCSGSDIFHHDKVDFQLHPQPQYDYFIRNHHIFCTSSRSYLSNQWVYSTEIAYDTRDLDSQDVPSWSERQPLIFWHGSLYKLASRAFLESVFRLVADDANLQFVFMGRDDQGKKGLTYILQHANRWKVSGRVHYEGWAQHGRDNLGNVTGEWEMIKRYLLQARLWPNSYPVGGGFARVEAYAAGAPSVHMGVISDESAWNRPQWSYVEGPSLLVTTGTAFNPVDYQTICRRCLYEESFANSLAREQRVVARRNSKGQAFWRGLIESYDDWRVRSTSYKISEE
jgi:hypothetical protein